MIVNAFPDVGKRNAWLKKNYSVNDVAELNLKQASEVIKKIKEKEKKDGKTNNN